MSQQAPKFSEQTALWSGAGGRGWVASQALIDELFRPLEELLLDAVPAETTSRVLDVGCGTGGTTVAAARRLGDQGRCTGVDVSEPMIAAARERAERAGAHASFIVADAQTQAFEPASFDTVISRFGVMFFNDPVAAFANLRRAVKAGGVLRLIVWRGPEDNPFMTTAERAAAPLLPELPPRRANEPGQFGFADRDYVRGVLEASGWSQLDIQPLDVPCAMPENALVGYFTQLGPVGRALEKVDNELRAEVVTRVRPAFEPYVRGAEVCFTAACWMISARA